MLLLLLRPADAFDSLVFYAHLLVIDSVFSLLPPQFKEQGTGKEIYGF